jgi:FkbM family methyltransferase
MSACIRTGGVVYDLGANRGIHTLLFARLVGPEGYVYAFEPVSEFERELMYNVSLNGFGNVTAVPFAASNRSGRETFFRGHHEGAGHLAANGDRIGARFEAHTLRVDDFVLRDGNRPPTFIKIDIEGAEGDALDGARAVLDQFKPTVLVDLHTPDQDALVGNLFADLGYTAHRTEDMHRIGKLREGWPDPEGIWGQVVAFPGA